MLQISLVVEWVQQHLIRYTSDPRGKPKGAFNLRCVKGKGWLVVRVRLHSTRNP